MASQYPYRASAGLWNTCIRVIRYLKECVIVGHPAPNCGLLTHVDFLKLLLVWSCLYSIRDARTRHPLRHAILYAHIPGDIISL